MRTRRAWPGMLCLLAFASELPAQEPAPPEERPAEQTPEELGAAICAAFQGYRKDLAGSLDFGLYLHGTQNIGRARITVGPAPEGSGAVYRLERTLDMRYGPVVVKEEEELLLDAAFGILARTAREEEQGPEGKQLTSKRLRREAGEWVLERSVDGEAETFRLPGGARHHGDAMVVALLLRALAPTEPQTFALQALEWPLAGGVAEQEPRYAPVLVTVSAAGPLHHRGERREGAQVQVDEARPGDDWSLDLGEGGRILSFQPKAYPIRFVVGTPEEVQRDLEPPPGQAARAGSPGEAVMTYLRVLAHALPPAALDGIMDWKAVQAEMGGESPELAKLPVERFADLVKSQFQAAEPPFSPADLEMVGLTLASEIQDDTARVTLPGSEDAFRLVRRDGSWRIAHFPH